MEPQTDHFAEAERWLAIAERRLLQRFERDLDRQVDEQDHDDD